MNIYRIVSEFQGDIALDDLTLTDGVCETNELFSCDFETSFCGMKNDTTARYSWTRQAGKKSAFSSTGPGVDHTVIKLAHFI